MRMYVRNQESTESQKESLWTQAPAKESVSYGALSQPPTRSRPRSDDRPTTVGVTLWAPPTQQPPSQAPAIHCKLSRNVVRAMSLYDRGKLQTVNGTKGVSSLIIVRYIYK